MKVVVSIYRLTKTVTTYIAKGSPYLQMLFMVKDCSDASHAAAAASCKAKVSTTIIPNATNVPS